MSSNNQQQPVQEERLDDEQSVVKWRQYTLILTAIAFIVLTLFMQLLCMLAKTCQMTGYFAYLISEQSILVFYFFTLFFLLMIYFGVIQANLDAVTLVKWPVLVYMIVVLIFAIISFSNVSVDQIKYNQLVPVLRQHYSYSQFSNKYQINQVLIGIYHAIDFGMLFLITASLYQFQLKLQNGWRPPSTSRQSGRLKLLYVGEQQEENIKVDDEQNESVEQQPAAQQPNIFARRVPNQESNQDNDEEQQLNNLNRSKGASQN
ncbi:hypothetical protein pb186bvf_007151 [Paramecium bursaria]